MEFKKIIGAALLLTAISFGANSASARSSYPGPLNAQLNTSGLSCDACHLGSQSASTAIQPLAMGWTSQSTASDADNDGISNGLELRFPYGYLYVNTTAAKPAGLVSGKFLVDSSAVSPATLTPVTDLYTATSGAFSLTGADMVIGGVSITPATNAGGLVTVAYETAEIATAKVYEISAGVATEITPVTINPKGNISFTTTAAGSELIIVGTTTTYINTGGGGYGDDEDGEGCITASASTPLMMFMAMLTLGFFVRRKKG